VGATRRGCGWGLLANPKSSCVEGGEGGLGVGRPRGLRGWAMLLLQNFPQHFPQHFSRQFSQHFNFLTHSTLVLRVQQHTKRQKVQMFENVCYVRYLGEKCELYEVGDKKQCHMVHSHSDQNNQSKHAAYTVFTLHTKRLVASAEYSSTECFKTHPGNQTHHHKWRLCVEQNDRNLSHDYTVLPCIRSKYGHVASLLRHKRHDTGHSFA